MAVARVGNSWGERGVMGSGGSGGREGGGGSPAENGGGFAAEAGGGNFQVEVIGKRARKRLAFFFYSRLVLDDLFFFVSTKLYH